MEANKKQSNYNPEFMREAIHPHCGGECEKSCRRSVRGCGGEGREDYCLVGQYGGAQQ